MADEIPVGNGFNHIPLPDRGDNSAWQDAHRRELQVPLRRYGPCDNQQFYNKWMGGNRVFDQLFLSGLNDDPFDQSWIGNPVPQSAFLLWYGNLARN